MIWEIWRTTGAVRCAICGRWPRWLRVAYQGRAHRTYCPCGARWTEQAQEGD